MEGDQEDEGENFTILFAIRARALMTVQVQDLQDVTFFATERARIDRYEENYIRTVPTGRFTRLAEYIFA